MKRFITLIVFLTFILTLAGCKSSTSDNKTNTPQNDTNSIPNAESKCPGSEYGAHKWLSPTCVEPSKCFWCDVYKDEKLSNHHNWYTYDNNLTKCQDCHILREDWLIQQGQSQDEQKENSSSNACANGHTEGEWVITSEPTLTYYGTETLSCSVCSEIIESRSTSKKKPKAQDSSFNFADEEFIDWINNNSKMKINETELGLFDDQYAWTSYLIETPDKESGVIVFAHENTDINSYIRSMLFIFDDYTTSIAIASAIAKGIDSKFDDAQAAISILFDDAYTSYGMSLIKFEDLFDDFGTIISLAPDGILS